MISTSIGINILALASGIFLIEKMNRDNMGWFYKTLAYLILILGLLNFGIIGAESMYKIYKKAGRFYQSEDGCKNCREKHICLNKRCLMIKDHPTRGEKMRMYCCQKSDSIKIEQSRNK